MAEKSFLWDSAGGGDASPHSEADTAALFSAIMRATGANKGVVNGMLNELIPSISGTNILMGSGYAIVNGHPYYNDTGSTIPITTPSTGTTGRRLVLRCNWAAQTVRAQILTSADGTASIPAMTQTPGTTYDIPIAAFTTTTGGVSAITEDQREFTSRSNVIKRKSAGQSLTATGVTFQNLTATSGNLDIDVKANEVWHVDLEVTYSCSTFGGLKLDFTAPAGASIVLQSHQAHGNIYANSADQITPVALMGNGLPAYGSAGAGINSIATTGTMRLRATILIGATAGKITARAAMNSAAGTTDITSGSLVGLLSN